MEMHFQDWACNDGPFEMETATLGNKIRVNVKCASCKRVQNYACGVFLQLIHFNSQGLWQYITSSPTYFARDQAWFAKHVIYLSDHYNYTPA